MNIRKQTNKQNARRKTRTRAKLFGTAERPRISIFKSNTHVYVQAIDDASQKTIASVSTVSSSRAESKDKTPRTKLGELIAAKLKEKKIVSAIFDRGAYQYHGYIKQLADEIRKNGIKV